MTHRLEHIGLDVDGVLRDMAGKLVEVFEREYPELIGQNLPINQWPAWSDFETYFPKQINLYHLSRKFQHQIWGEAPLYPDVLPTLQRLAEERTLHIVTSQPTEASARFTKAWLKQVKIPVLQENVHITSCKEEAPVQVLVDDMLHNLEAATQAQMIGICRTQAWNRGWQGLRLGSLDELCPLLDALESGEMAP